MMTLLTGLMYGIGGWFAILSFHVMTMKAGELRRRGDQIPMVWRVIAEPWYWAGVLASAALNFTIGWLLFRESPLRFRELTLSARVSRHFWFWKLDNSRAPVRRWRRSMAGWWRKHLNAVQEGHV